MNVARMPDDVKKKIELDSINASSASDMNHREKGAITGHLNNAFGGDDSRKLALSWLFGRLGMVTPSDPDTYITGLSSKSLSKGDWWALSIWIGAQKDDGGEWKTRLEFPLEASLVLGEALKAYMSLPVDRLKEDRSFVTDMTAQTVSQLGGIITNIQQPDGSYPNDPEQVALPPQLQAKPEAPRLFKPPPQVDF